MVSLHNLRFTLILSNGDTGTAYVYGEPITPCALADGKGNTSVVLVSHYGVNWMNLQV